MATISSVHIRNYKSIKDSGPINIENGMTVFAGKNESGKTSILQAIEDFDTEKKIRGTSIPITGEDTPEIDVTIKLSSEEIFKFTEKMKPDYVDFPDGYEIKLRKSFPDKYSLLSHHFSNQFEDNIETESQFNSDMSAIQTKVADMIENIEFKFKSDIITEIMQEIKGLDIGDNAKKDLIDEVTKVNSNYKNNIVDIPKVSEKFITEIKKYIPYFILFDTSEDQKIPDEIPLAQISTNQFVSDLKEISNLDLELIKDINRNRDQAKHQKNVNIRLKKEYKRFWEQDLSNLYIDWRNNKLFLYIEEGGEFYPPSMRSKGRQWHIAFYIKVGARSKEDKPNFLLIDEPGLFLHSKAQRDILRQMKESSSEMQIIYSTHSPYLIDPNNLQIIRLIEKDDSSGTKGFGITARPKHQDTLTPIITAIGEDQAQGIRADRPDSIITEGFTDFLWLKSFRELLGKEDMNIIPGSGGSSPVNIGCILFGWGLNSIYLLDNDKQGKNNREKLVKKLGVKADSIIMVPDKEDGEIEDLFSKKDKKLYFDLQNGDKRILATKFLNGVKSGDIKIENLEKETVNNFEKLFEKLSNT